MDVLGELVCAQELDARLLELGSGEPGELTRTLQRLYDRAARAEPPYRQWATPVYERVEA